MNNQEFILLAMKVLSGEADSEDTRQMHELLENDSQKTLQFQLLERYWNEQAYINQPRLEESLQKVLVRLELQPNFAGSNRRIRSISRSRVFAAACVIVAIISGLVIYLNSKKYNPQPLGIAATLEKKQNSKGTKSTIQLSDGSKIWLNSDSKLQYPSVFDGKTREVYLNGEAFFDVAKNPSKPFIIHLQNGTIQVIGTSFNIRAYDNEKKIETSVSTGKVAFIPKSADLKRKNDTVFLLPDTKATYLFTADKLVTVPTISRDDKAWTEGKLKFNNMSFEEIGLELERNFGMKVVFASDKVRKYRLTGSFQNNTLEEIMFYFSKTKDFAYRITGTELLITDIAEEFGKDR